MRIIENASLVDMVEDWSNVRSHGRAERRRKQGHRQNIVMRAVPKKVVYQMGDAMVMHPATAAELRRRLPEAPAPGRSVDFSIFGSLPRMSPFRVVACLGC
jgi:hypothetical protein